MPSITAHMIVKNEDQWIWFAIHSILPYVDKFLITDTGSIDHTPDLIRSISSPKVKFSQTKTHSPAEITQIRNEQIKATKTKWFWLVDGDEIYPRRLCQEILKLTAQKSLVGIIVRRHDLLGDIYHCQSETVGSYHLYGQTGHFSTRLINLDQVPDLLYRGDYPLEGLYDSHHKTLKTYPDKSFAFTKYRYWHAGYLKRSSLGGNLPLTFNRKKYKIETGIQIHTPLPEIFSTDRPDYVPDPLKTRGFGYELASAIITPLKKIKRKLL